MKNRLYVHLQEVHPTLIEITNRINKKKGLLEPFFIVHYLSKEKLIIINKTFWFIWVGIAE